MIKPEFFRCGVLSKISKLNSFLKNFPGKAPRISGRKISGIWGMKEKRIEEKIEKKKKKVEKEESTIVCLFVSLSRNWIGKNWVLQKRHRI